MKSIDNPLNEGVAVSKKVNYDVLVEENAVGLFYLENDRVAFSNKAFADVFGVLPSVLVGTSIFDKVRGDDRKLLENGIEALLRGDTDSFSRDLQLKRNEEEDVYFSLHLKVHSRDDNLVQLIGASREATTRVRKSKELVRTQSRFEALYRNIVDGIIVYDCIDEVMIDCNDAAVKILGYKTSQSLLKLNRYEFIPKTSSHFPGMDLHKETKNHSFRVLKGEAFNCPGALMGYGGKEVLVTVNIVPTFNKLGEAFIIFHDITDEILGKRSKKESDKRYRDIFNNSHEAIVYRDLKTGKPIICNKKALDLFGVSTFQEFIDLDRYSFYDDEYADYVLNEALEKGRADLAFWLKKQNGESIRIAGVLIRDVSDPDNPKIISFLRDVTRLHQAQVELNKKNEELKKYIDSNLQLENFAYFASHDLQTPLRSMISFTQLLKSKLKGRLSEEEEEYMQFIISSSKSMRNLINDLLSYSRINTTKINIREINLQTILAKLCIELDSIIQDKKAKIILKHIPEFIRADSTKIKQIFQNLITNAIKFSQEGTSPIVTINCKNNTDHWLFSVKDNGIGIAPEFQDKIFLLFKRLHTSTEYEGTGIGLAMVKKIIEQHEGEIGLESKQGEGACFWFTIKK